MSLHGTGAQRRATDRKLFNGLHASTPKRILNLPIVEENAPDAIITDARYIGSYNWHGTATRPTMLVPVSFGHSYIYNRRHSGSPRILVDKQTPFILQPDVGHVPCNYNGRMSPSAPMLPTVLAVEATTPEFDWSSVDFVTDRNGLRKLLQWVTGKKPDFRLDFHLLGERTVSFQRFEPRKTMPTGGYGMAFEDAVTRREPGFHDSPHHHRITCYSFGTLKLVVRYEVDACAAPESMAVEELATSLADQSLGGPTPLRTVSIDRSNTISVIKLGRTVPQDRIVELTSTSGGPSSPKYMQMYLSQTPQIVIGRYEKGLFTSVTRQGIYAGFEEHAQTKLKMLRAVLEMLHAMVVAEGSDGRFSLVWHGGQMEVFERASGARCLPEAYLKKFLDVQQVNNCVCCVFDDSSTCYSVSLNLAVHIRNTFPVSSSSMPTCSGTRLSIATEHAHLRCKPYSTLT
ncbi:hypothetical protein BDZ89DRAFT_1139363 [Hymenopellis radicata]|nr:hypothetical protein BDZ89DRAFT_1139363 [Hymenopellis radicata]